MMETPELFGNFALGLTGAAVIAWLIVSLLYLIFSLILVYHWRQYATNAAVTRTTLVWYFSSTGTCLIIAATLILFV